jgi:long-subunit fatty acid transport protein
MGNKMKQNQRVKSYIFILILTLCLNTGHVNAAGIQFFPQMAYTNPASLSLVNKFSFTAGGGFLRTKLKFNGTQVGVTGESTCHPKYSFPYGQIAWRPSEQWILGFDVSEPSFAYLDFKTGNLAGIKSRILTVNYSPKICFQPFEYIAFGLGLDIQQNRRADLNFFTPAGHIINHGKGEGMGWDAGFLWKIQPTSILSGSFHSQVTTYAKGTSTLGGISTRFKVNVPTPQTITLNYLQILTDEWLVNLTARHCKWDYFQRQVLYPTAVGLVVFPVQYNNSWVGQIITRYQFAEQWAGLLAYEFESRPESIKHRPVNLPADQIWIAGIGLQYLPTTTFQVQLVLGHAQSKPKINDSFTQGKFKITGNFADISVTYKF